MIVTGIVLAMHYTPTTAGAFTSVENIMRNPQVRDIYLGKQAAA